MNVCAYATALGRSLGLPEEDLTNMALAALLHDVGTTKVPRAIIDKRGPLTTEEREIVRRHPWWSVQLLGADLLKRPVARAVILHHHERLDGSGYPHGPAGTEVRLPARIVSLVDVYDALTSERPYRAPLSPANALRSMGAEMRGQFDGDLFAAFVGMLADDGEVDEGTQHSGTQKNCTRHGTGGDNQSWTCVWSMAFATP